MATYYNKMRMGLSLPLARGGSVLVPAKGQISLDPEDEGTLELRQLVERGYVSKTPLASAPAAVVAPPAPPVVTPAVSVQTEAVPAEPPAVVSAETPAAPPSEETFPKVKRKRGSF